MVVLSDLVSFSRNDCRSSAKLVWSCMMQLMEGCTLCIIGATIIVMKYSPKQLELIQRSVTESSHHNTRNASIRDFSRIFGTTTVRNN
jgi:hypothetical protein